MGNQEVAHRKFVLNARIAELKYLDTNDPTKALMAEKEARLKQFADWKASGMDAAATNILNTVQGKPVSKKKIARAPPLHAKCTCPFQGPCEPFVCPKKCPEPMCPPCPKLASSCKIVANSQCKAESDALFREADAYEFGHEAEVMAPELKPVSLKR